MNNKNMLIEISHRLSAHKAPTETQRKFLRCLGADLEDGLSIQEALAKPAPDPVKNGKQSDFYRVAKLNRNKHYRQAFDLLTGSPWSRCSQIVKDLNCIRFALDHNEPLPNNEYTRLLIWSIKSGIKQVTTIRQLHKILNN